MKRCPLQFLLLQGGVLFCLFLASEPTAAQIVPDATLPSNSIVTPQGNTSLIEGGTRAGSNLFHSFQEFSVPTNTEAFFNNALDIQNIFSRVTGNSISNIDGLIRANGAANLFLLNPNGIIFGPNAQLNIGGSFLASTANSVRFADGTSFGTTNPQTAPLLTISVPVGLQMGPNPGNIVVQGPGHNLSSNPETSSIIRDNRPVGLQVAPSQTLALLGGNIALEGGNLTAAGGRIELGSVGGETLVTLTPINQGMALSYPEIANFQDISLSKAASVDVSGAGGGNVFVVGRRVTLTDGSGILSLTEGAASGGTLSVRASEVVEAIGTTPDGQFPGGLFTEVQPQATGEGGNLTIETGRLFVKDGAQISTSTFGEGQGGTLTVKATDSVEAIGTNGQLVSRLFADVQPGATGDGGDLTIETGRLLVKDGAQISASTFGKGQGGTLTVKATDSVEAIGRSADDQFSSGLFANAEQGATGDGSDLTIETTRLLVKDGAQIGAGTFGVGQGGTLKVKASYSVEVIGRSVNGQFASRLFTDAQPKATGDGGNLTIETGRLLVKDGAQISAGTFGVGQGGTLRVKATDSVEVIGRSANGKIPSGLFVNAARGSTGKGGDLTIETGRLLVKDGATIGAGTFGAGQGGTLVVKASDSVEVIGTSANGKAVSALFASAESGSTGDGGNLTIETARLRVADGALIGTDTFGSGKAGNLTVKATDTVEVIGISANGQLPSGLFASVNPEATGDGGNLTIETAHLRVADGAQIAVATSGSGKAGNLTVKAGDMVELIGTSADGRAVSGLFASDQPGATGDGGNVTIETARLRVADGALVSTLTFGPGKAGNLTVKAEDVVELIGTSADGKASSGLFASVAPGATGDGGNLTIETTRLRVADGAEVSTDTFSFGKAGNLTVKAEDVVELIGTSADGKASSGLFASVRREAAGDGGNLTIETARLRVADGAQVSTSTFSAGKAGNLTVKASDMVELLGTSADGKAFSGLFASAEPGAVGEGGNLNIETDRLRVADGAIATVRSRGEGKAGNLTVDAGSILLDNSGSLTADTKAGGGSIELRSPSITLRGGSSITTNAQGGESGGDIDVQASSLILRQNSTITTNAQGSLTGTEIKGGNISLDTDVIAALENSDISANSDNFFGGRVSINAQAIFGSQFRSALTPDSDITATGGTPELSGTVEINTPEVDPTSGLIELPTNLVDATNQLVSACPTGTRFANNEFFITGRGGVPPNPREALSNNAIGIGWVTLSQEQGSRGAGGQGSARDFPTPYTPNSKPYTQPTKERLTPAEIVEANGWVIGANGEVILTANLPNATPYQNWHWSETCPGMRSNN